MHVVFLRGTTADPTDGGILAAYVSRQEAIRQRKLSGDLVFDNEGNIDQGTDWLFPWEHLNERCYARRMQRARLSLKGVPLTCSWTTEREQDLYIYKMFLEA